MEQSGRSRITEPRSGGVGYPPAVLAASTWIARKNTAKAARRTADQIQVPAFNVRGRVVFSMCELHC